MLVRNAQYRAHSKDIKKDIDIFSTNIDLILEKDSLKKSYFSCLIC